MPRLYDLRHETKYIIPFDWARGETRAFIFGEIHTFKNPFELIKYLRTYPDKRFLLVCEASLCSYPSTGAMKVDDATEAGRQERDKFIRECKEYLYKLYTFDTRNTKNTRRKIGLQKNGKVYFPKDLSKIRLTTRERKYLLEDLKNIAKNLDDNLKDKWVELDDSTKAARQIQDTVDDLALLYMGRFGYIYKMKTTEQKNADSDFHHRKKEANRLIRNMRADDAKAAFGAYVFVNSDIPTPGKQPKGKGLSKLPTMNEEASTVWGKDGNFNLGFLAVVAVATAFSKNGKEFDKIIGFSSNAPRSMIRSEVLYHRWRHFIGKDRWKELEKSDFDEYKERRNLFQRELRRMRSILVRSNVSELLENFRKIDDYEITTFSESLKEKARRKQNTLTRFWEADEKVAALC